MATNDAYVVSMPTDIAKNLKFMSFGGTKTASISGFYKTILQWVKCFLTPIGSDLSDTTYGTEIAWRIGQAFNPDDITDIAAMSVSAATDKILEYQQNRPLPSNERLASVVLNKVTYTTSSVDIWVTITNSAKEVLTLSLPVAVTAPMSTP